MLSQQSVTYHGILFLNIAPVFDYLVPKLDFTEKIQAKTVLSRARDCVTRIESFINLMERDESLVSVQDKNVVPSCAFCSLLRWTNPI